jgi:diguanylate cyclase (GGDEF)-like protein
MITVAAFFWVVPTLFLMFAIAFAAVGWHPNGTKSARWAALGFLTAAAGSIFDTQRTYLPPMFNTLATPAHWIAVYALLQSILVRHDQKIARIPLLIWAATSLSAHIFLVTFNHPLPDRVLLMNITVPVIMAMAFVPMLRSRKRPIDTVLVWLVGGAIITYPLRIAMFVIQDQARELLGPYAWSQYSIIFYLVTAALGIFTALAIMMTAGMDIIAKSEKDTVIDPLTGIGNRRALDRWIEQESTESEKFGAAIMIDLDRFKSINDTFGHDAGDQVLVAVARQIEAKLGDFARIARIGGEEIVVLVFERHSQAAAALSITVREAIAAIKLPAPLDKIRVTASVGLAMSGSDCDLRTAMRRADMAVYQAKADGRNATIQAQVRNGLCIMRKVG